MADAPVSHEWIAAFHRDSLRLALHPAVRAMDKSFSVDLPADAAEVFRVAVDLANAPGTGTIFDELRARGEAADWRYFLDLILMGVREGLCAVRYHLLRFQDFECQAKEGYERAVRLLDQPIVRPLTIGAPGQVMVFEFEAFTLMSRATLDRLSFVLSYYFLGKTEENLAGTLFRLERQLHASGRGDQRRDAVLRAIDAHRPFLETLISRKQAAGWVERDTLAHQRYVPFGQTVNVQIGQDPARPLRVFLAFPGFDGRVEAADELANRFHGLAKAVVAIVRALLCADAG